MYFVRVVDLDTVIKHVVFLVPGNGFKMMFNYSPRLAGNVGAATSRLRSYYIRVQFSFLAAHSLRNVFTTCYSKLTITCKFYVYVYVFFLSIRYV